MTILQLICSLAVLAGILMAFVSLFYLKEGLPECFTGLNQCPRPLRDYYRAPGYSLWVVGVGLIVVGWLGDLIIKNRADAELLAWLPLDVIIIGVGCSEVLISLFWLRRGPAATESIPNTGVVHHLKNRYRGPGFRLAWVGAATALLGAITAALIRII